MPFEELLLYAQGPGFCGPWNLLSSVYNYGIKTWDMYYNIFFSSGSTSGSLLLVCFWPCCGFPWCTVVPWPVNHASELDSTRQRPRSPRSARPMTPWCFTSAPPADCSGSFLNLLVPRLACRRDGSQAWVQSFKFHVTEVTTFMVNSYNTFPNAWNWRLLFEFMLM